MIDFRNNRVLLMGGGICAVLLLATSIFLLRANLEYNKKSQLLVRQYHRLNELNTRRPFPSVEHVEMLEKNLDQLEYQTSELGSLFMRDHFPPDAVEAADFSARAQEVIERFGKRAKHAGIMLPENLEAGFGQYASGGAIPEQRYVPRLSRQLYSVERVADVLIRGGVHSIDALTRDGFEAQEDVVEPAGNRRRRRPLRGELPKGTPSDNLHEVASAVHPDGLYYVERIGVVFTAKEEGVWRVLDLLASVPHFMVVAEFSHTTQSEILDYNPEAVRRGEGGGDATMKFLAEGILTGKQALSRPERIIAGNEMVRVTIAVDVYNIEPVRSGADIP